MYSESINTTAVNEDAVRQYDIWLASLVHPGDTCVIRGTRPVIVVSNETVNRCSRVLSVVPLTANLNKTARATHVFLRTPGLERASLALCEQVTAIDRNCLVRRLGSVEAPFQRIALQHSLAVQLGMLA